MHDGHDEVANDFENCVGISEADCEVWSDNEDKMNPFVTSVTCKLQPRKHVSMACWNDKHCMAEVTEIKGSIWTSTGVIRNGKLYLFLEEALFLVQRRALIISKFGGEPLSVAELLQKLAEPSIGCTFKYFAAYKRLKLLGYIVGRHNIPWTMKGTNGCHSRQHSNENHQDNVNEKGEDIATVSLLLNNLLVNEIKPVFDVYLSNSKFRKSSPGSPDFILCMLGDSPPGFSSLDELENAIERIPLRYCHVGHSSRVIFLSSNKLELQTLP